MDSEIGEAIMIKEDTNESLSPVSKKKKFKIKLKAPEDDKFSSFQILWFDIETKVREVVNEVINPLNDNITDLNKNMITNKQAADDTHSRAVELEKTVYN